MPITQERMLTLLREFEATAQALTGYRQDIEEALAKVRQGALTPAEAIGLVEIAGFRTWPATPALTIEAYHFNKTKRRNERERDRNRQRRLSQGLATGPSSAPTTLVRSVSEGPVADPLDDYRNWNKETEE